VFGRRFFLLASVRNLVILSIIMARVYSLRRKSTLALRQRKAALLRQLAVPPESLRASVVERFGTCGKSNCACHQGAKHGPYYYLTQCLAPGRVQKFLLKTEVAQAAARAGAAAFSRFYDRLEELSQINTELLRRDEPLNGSAA
jgi:hypothetical protein